MQFLSVHPLEDFVSSSSTTNATLRPVPLDTNQWNQFSCLTLENHENSEWRVLWSKSIPKLAKVPFYWMSWKRFKAIWKQPETHNWDPTINFLSVPWLLSSKKHIRVEMFPAAENVEDTTFTRNLRPVVGRALQHGKDVGMWCCTKRKVLLYLSSLTLGKEFIVTWKLVCSHDQCPKVTTNFCSLRNEMRLSKCRSRNKKLMSFHDYVDLTKVCASVGTTSADDDS